VSLPGDDNAERGGDSHDVARQKRQDRRPWASARAVGRGEAAGGGSGTARATETTAAARARRVDRPPAAGLQPVDCPWCQSGPGSHRPPTSIRGNAPQPLDSSVRRRRSRLRDAGRPPVPAPNVLARPRGWPDQPPAQRSRALSWHPNERAPTASHPARTRSMTGLNPVGPLRSRTETGSTRCRRGSEPRLSRC
jgi:hypothetical protein